MENCKIIYNITRPRTKGHGFNYQKNCLDLAGELLNSIFERLETVKLRTVSRKASSSSTMHRVCSKNFVAPSSLNWGTHKVET